MDINSASTIFIPDKLNKQEVKLAILNAIEPVSYPITQSAVESMVDAGLTAGFGPIYDFVRERKGYWFVEDIRKDSVFAGYDNGKHYFRVEYIIGDYEILQRIDASRNLKQTEDSIHKRVFTWLGQMESRIRQSMGNVVIVHDRIR
ncbi:hypothetical protein DJ030_17080 [bacterium endosymbiont of Escarpia laminata]|nr:MAG: hypothetical protein DJ030_17080 [bacterium endosymbiont of Escarpia laminata]